MGMVSSTVNAMLAATAWNLKKLMGKLKGIFCFVYYWKILPSLTPTFALVINIGKFEALENKEFLRSD